jgi:DNA helicase II / ATP-dependent DNA helicase PcrA
MNDAKRLGLNPSQYAAVKTASGPLLVLAGAGSGKTRVVTYRIAELIRKGTKPERILAVTFTNKAAGEMKQRVGELLGKRQPGKPEISTFHSLCVRILRRNATRLGYPNTFSIYDSSDQESLARTALREIQVPNEVMKPSDFLHIVSGWKSQSIRPEQAAMAATNDKEHLASMAYRRYQRALKNAGAVDFDDLLLLTEDLFASHVDARRAESGRFDHLLIDEYQDTNQSQYRIVKSLAAAHRNLCVVGDDDQSIYGWRGAEVTHILNFKKDWPEASVVRLEENYRCTGAILELANRLILFNRTRHAKVLKADRPLGEKPRIMQYKDEEDEAKQTVADIARRATDPTLSLRDFAILFRTNEQPRVFEQELRKAKIPYVLIGGRSFFDRTEVRDLLAYLKTLARPDDEPSLLRIINTPPRSIGAKAVETLVAKAIEQKTHVGTLLEQGNPVVTPAMRAFAGLLHDYRPRFTAGSLTSTFRELVAKIQYLAEIKRRNPNPEDHESRLQTVEEFVNALSQYETQAKSKATLQGFIDQITLQETDDPDEKEKQLKRNAVALMTLHASKGLEFSQVYMVGLEEGVLPHHRSLKVGSDTAIEEERRLCYVGITRARDRLTLSLPLSRMKWGKPRDTIPSRFLFEITGQAESPRAVAAVRNAAAVFSNKEDRPKATRAKKPRA